MKKLFLMVFLAGAFAACKNDQTSTSAQDTTAATEPEVVAETVDELPNPYDIQFEESLEAFRAKDNAKAALYIEKSIAEIKKEAPAVMEKGAEKQFNNSIASLQELADRVKNGQVTDEATLIEAFGYADMVTAHGYFWMTQIYAEKDPAKATMWYQRAQSRVASAENKLQGESKVECTNILAKVNAALAKGDKKADAIGNAAGRHVEDLFAWLKVHAAKIGIHPPERTNY